MLISVGLCFVLGIRRAVKHCRVIVGVPLDGLPVRPHETSGLLEVCCVVEVLFAPLNLSLHAPSRLAPLSEVGGRFFVTSLLGQLLVFVLPPDRFELLLLQVIGRVVHEVIGAPLELVDCRISDLLLAVRVELLEAGLECGAFSLRELIIHL